MKIGLIDVDGRNFPNIALMKISAFHKAKGDAVEWCDKDAQYDIVYQAKVFSELYSKDIDWTPKARTIIKGGTGYTLDGNLPEEIEHQYPDYELYPELCKDKAYGFLTRGCPRGCSFCIVAQKEGRKSIKVADLDEWWRGQKGIILLDPNILACKNHRELLKQLGDSKAIVEFTQGLDARLLTEESIELLNRIKVKSLHFAWDSMNEMEGVIKGLSLYNKYGKIKDFRRKRVYVLTNYGTNTCEDLLRIYTLRNIGYDPFVMVYNKPDAPLITRRMQRWCNSKYIFRVCPNFEDYTTTKRKESKE